MKSLRACEKIAETSAMVNEVLTAKDSRESTRQPEWTPMQKAVAIGVVGLPIGKDSILSSGPPSRQCPSTQGPGYTVPAFVGTKLRKKKVPRGGEGDYRYDHRDKKELPPSGYKRLFLQLALGDLCLPPQFSGNLKEYCLALCGKHALDCARTPRELIPMHEVAVTGMIHGCRLEHHPKPVWVNYTQSRSGDYPDLGSTIATRLGFHRAAGSFRFNVPELSARQMTGGSFDNQTASAKVPRVSASMSPDQRSRERRQEARLIAAWPLLWVSGCGGKAPSPSIYGFILTTTPTS
ncbi:hypothetical protein B0H13DRAFT_1890101 [Mycena leptocephala]|nr:hypothetical protein B0H13DRAFT_1890101 [Mycena leptocephala]